MCKISLCGKVLNVKIFTAWKKSKNKSTFRCIGEVFSWRKSWCIRYILGHQAVMLDHRIKFACLHAFYVIINGFHVAVSGKSRTSISALRPEIKLALDSSPIELSHEPILLISLHFERPWMRAYERKTLFATQSQKIKRRSQKLLAWHSNAHACSTLTRKHSRTFEVKQNQQYTCGKSSKFSWLGKINRQIS